MRSQHRTLAALLVATLAYAPAAFAQDPHGAHGGAAKAPANRAGGPAAAGSTAPSGAGAGTIGAAGAAGASAGGAAAAGAAANAAVTPDLATLARLHASNQSEIEHGQMAVEKAKSPQVKSYGRRLVSDHKAADAKLLAYCQKKKVDKDALTREATAEQEKKKADPSMAKLHTLSGEEFDKEFAAAMAAEHQKTIDFVTTSRDGATDPALKTMLTKLLPKLEKHRTQAQALADKLSKS